MEHSAPQILQWLEASDFAAAVRQAVWIYPIANVAHVLAVMTFFATVAAMDVRLLGAFPQVPAGAVVRTARWLAAIAFAVVAISGFVLFAAEATHVALNWVFQAKMALVVLGLCNVLAFEILFGRQLRKLPAKEPLPIVVRLSAVLSLAIWFAVAACGRSIAYA